MLYEIALTDVVRGYCRRFFVRIPDASNGIASQANITQSDCNCYHRDKSATNRVGIGLRVRRLARLAALVLSRIDAFMCGAFFLVFRFQNALMRPSFARRMTS